jgi:HSP20 family protein
MNSIRFYNTFAPVHRRLISDLFNNLSQEDTNESSGCGCVPANIIENGDQYLIELSVPGFSKEQISIKVDKDVLVVKSDRKENEGVKYVRREFGSANFERRFVLSKQIDSDKISASFRNGILEISLPLKVEAKQPESIEIDIH